VEMDSSRDRRLIHDLTAVGALVDWERASADERLSATVGPDLAAQFRGATGRRLRFERFAARLARMKQWQWSMVIVSLGCGVAVSTMGVIELIWQFRSVLSGLGAVAVVLAVFLKSRQHRIEETWLGS
jgi:hypothetical protein